MPKVRPRLLSLETDTEFTGNEGDGNSIIIADCNDSSLPFIFSNCLPSSGPFFSFLFSFSSSAFVHMSSALA